MSGTYKRKGHNIVRVWGNAKKKIRTSMMPLSTPAMGLASDESTLSESGQSTNKQATTHQQKMLSQSTAWDEIRVPMLHTRIQNMTPKSRTCMLCSRQQDNIIRCLDCGPRFLLCNQCSTMLHSSLFMHCPEMWQEQRGMFTPVDVKPHVMLANHDTDVCFKYDRCLVIFDQYGNPRTVTMEFCSCQTEAETLVSYDLWPGTPQSPNVAFDFKLLEQYTVLQLGCHLSAKGFCEALKNIQDFRIRFQEQFRSLHRAFSGEMAAEYRHHRLQLQSTTCLGKDVAIGPECPICTLESTTPVVCMDGNFGLVQKSNAGEGQGSNRNMDKFFLSQRSLRQFVEDYAVDKKTVNHCSNFQAGNVLRSKVKNKKLTFKGVFGSICQHEIPLKFINLEHGERLAYPVFLLKEILKEKSDKKVVVMYDIACMLHKHLQKRRDEALLASSTFCVPVFHSFAHNLKCKMTYGQRNVEGTGLCDGEGIERLWSYLRPFNKITKEMTQRNRHDLLSDALHHHSVKQISKMAETLKKRKLRAEAKLKSANEVKLSVMSSLNATDEDLKDWKEILQKPKSGLKKSTEERHDEQLKSMQELAIERQYLLSSLRKYADGQDAAIRLTRKISTVTSKLRKCLDAFQSDNKLEFHQISDPESYIYTSGQLTSQRIEALEMDNMIKRCQEELVLASEDMKLYFKALSNKNECLKTQLMKEENTGVKYLLSLQKLKLETLLWNCVHEFSDLGDLSFDRMMNDFLNKDILFETQKLETLFQPVVDTDVDSSCESDEDLDE